MKLCECGCGQQTSLASRTFTKRGWVKGQPVKFIRGHATRFQGTLQERFEKFFDKTPNTCWDWKGGKSKGYGTFYPNHTSAKLASRISYELYKGPIPKGHYVLHKCDNPPCVNPEHLFIGTAKDNVQDMIKKGRRRK